MECQYYEDMEKRKRPIHTVMDSDLLKLGGAKAEGNNLNNKYYERGQEGKRQSIRLDHERRSELV